MASRRTLRAAEAIRQVVSMAILSEIKDPRVSDVTVTGVEVAPDMRQAKILVTIMGNETKQQLSLRGLQSSAGFLQSRIADRIDTRYTPKLIFELDKGAKNSQEVGKILRELHTSGPAEEAQEEAVPAPEEAPSWEDPGDP